MLYAVLVVQQRFIKTYKDIRCSVVLSTDTQQTESDDRRRTWQWKFLDQWKNRSTRRHVHTGITSNVVRNPEDLRLLLLALKDLISVLHFSPPSWLPVHYFVLLTTSSHPCLDRRLHTCSGPYWHALWVVLLVCRLWLLMIPFICFHSFWPT